MVKIIPKPGKYKAKKKKVKHERKVAKPKARRKKLKNESKVALFIHEGTLASLTSLKINPRFIK